MPVNIVVPPLGESLVDAVVGNWLKSEGDAVSRGETIVELETDKVNLDVTASEDGVLSKIERQPGDVVKVGELLAVIAEGAGAGNGAKSAASAQAAVVAAPVAAAPAPAPVAPPPAPAPGPVVEAADAGGRAAPAVRRLAEDHNVNVEQVAGSGPAGRVTREDVLAHATRQVAPAPAAYAQPSAPPAPLGREERVRMSRRRQTIANRLVEAQQTAAMLTTFNEVDMTAVMEMRKAHKESFQKKNGVGLGFMSFFTKAVIGGLKAYPRINAEIQGDEMVLKHYYDIGVAVGVEEGLVVPVVRNADQMNFAEIEKEILSLATRAREGKLAISDLTGGTFTITNGGVFGSLLSTPILNMPQVGILGMHTIQQRPVAVNGQVVIRPMMYIALSYDHRIVDGREAVLFLVKVKELIEDPAALLLEG